MLHLEATKRFHAHTHMQQRQQHLGRGGRGWRCQQRCQAHFHGRTRRGGGGGGGKGGGGRGGGGGWSKRGGWGCGGRSRGGRGGLTGSCSAGGGMWESGIAMKELLYCLCKGGLDHWAETLGRRERAGGVERSGI
ncbi:unnamed protein product [Closterium sp. NIES-53]